LAIDGAKRADEPVVKDGGSEMQRPKKPSDPNELRPCLHVDFCRKNELKSCDNCFEMFWRNHAEPPVEEIEAAFQAGQDAEQASWSSSTLF